MNVPLLPLLLGVLVAAIVGPAIVLDYLEARDRARRHREIRENLGRENG